MSYALTDKEEKLHDLCQHYEELFDYHARNYNMSLPLGAKHISFSHHKTPTNFTCGTVQRLTFEGAFAVASLNGLSSLSLGVLQPRGETGYARWDANSTADGNLGGILPLSQEGYSIRVSDTSPKAGITRSVVGSIFDFTSWVVDIDQGAFVISTYKGDDGHFFKTDCTECANLMAKFLTEARQIMQN